MREIVGVTPALHHPYSPLYLWAMDTDNRIGGVKSVFGPSVRGSSLRQCGNGCMFAPEPHLEKPRLYFARSFTVTMLLFYPPSDQGSLPPKPRRGGEGTVQNPTCR